MKKSRGNSSSCSGNEDRISNLPDALIHQILSCIDMKYVVHTCILSRRWRYIWTSLPVLHFQDLLHEEDEEKDDLESDHNCFVNFVNKVLSLRDNSDIHTFDLDGYFNGDITEGDIHKWIATAVSHNVQELVIQIRIDEDFEIPACLCTSKSLTKLELYLYTNWAECKVILPSAMSLPQLKSLNLHFESVTFNDEKLTNKFFSSFPALETLVMRNCGFDNMNINMSFPNLKYFELGDPFHENCNEVKLYAPSLTSLIFNGYMPASFTLENLSSLVDADILIRIKREDKGEGDFPEIHAHRKEWYTQLMMRLLKGLHNAKVLKIKGSFLEALGGSPDILDSQPLWLYYLQLLELSLRLSRDSVGSIFYMLKISPNIESLYLRLGSEGRRNHRVYPFGDEEIMEHSICSFHHHLKFVEIEGFRGRDIELEFLEILLKHAMVLEKVVLCSRSTKEELKQKEKQMEKFCEMLLTFSRASTNVIISYSVSD